MVGYLKRLNGFYSFCAGCIASRLVDSSMYFSVLLGVFECTMQDPSYLEVDYTFNTYQAHSLLPRITHKGAST